MLTAFRRRGHQTARRAFEFDGLSDQIKRPERLRCHRLWHLQVAHLRVGKGLIDIVNRPAGNPGIVKHLDPMFGRLGPDNFVDPGIQRIPVGRALFFRFVIGMVE